MVRDHRDVQQSVGVFAAGSLLAARVLLLCLGLVVGGCRSANENRSSSSTRDNLDSAGVAPVFANEPRTPVDEANTASTPSSTEPTPGWLCVYPHAQPFNECSKGTSASEKAAASCFARQAKRLARRPRFRLGDGPWIEFSDNHWRCVPVSKEIPAETRITIENFGKPWRSWKIGSPYSCPAHIADLTRQNWYTAIDTSCSRRDTAGDERLEDYAFE